MEAARIDSRRRETSRVQRRDEDAGLQVGQDMPARGACVDGQGNRTGDDTSVLDE